MFLEREREREREAGRQASIILYIMSLIALILLEDAAQCGIHNSPIGLLSDSNSTTVLVLRYM